MAYTTRADVRALKSLDDTDVYTDDMVDEGIAWATRVIDEACGTAFETKTKTLTLDGTNTSTIATGVPMLQGVTSCTIDGTEQTVDNWVVTDDGIVRRDSGTFTFTSPGRNVVLVVTHGAFTTVPDDIAWAARTLARYYVVALQSDIPERALSITGDYGQVMLAQPGGKYGPSALPDVNAVLKNYNYRPPAVG